MAYHRTTLVRFLLLSLAGLMLCLALVSFATVRLMDAAVRRRRPPDGVIFHSDRGSEYVAATFRDRLVALGMRQSSTRRGPEDNAHMESFFHTLKAELVHGARFETEAALRQELRQYFQYYNHQRLHSGLGYRSPVDYESQAA